VTRPAKKKHPVNMTETEFREYVAQWTLFLEQLEPRLKSIDESHYRIQQELRGGDIRVREYHERIHETNEILRRDVRSLLEMVDGKHRDPFTHEPVDDTAVGSIRTSHPAASRSASEVVSEDMVDGLRAMSRAIIRRHINKDRLLDEGAIRERIRTVVPKCIDGVVDNELGLDTWGKLNDKSKLARILKSRIDSIFAVMTAPGQPLSDTVDRAIKKGFDRFLKKTGEAAMVTYVADELRSSFHDMLMKRVHESAEAMAEHVMRTTFERALHDEMPFLRSFESLLALGAEDRLPSPADVLEDEDEGG
jgi:hypothetical protein